MVSIEKIQRQFFSFLYLFKIVNMLSNDMSLMYRKYNIPYSKIHGQRKGDELLRAFIIGYMLKF